MKNDLTRDEWLALSAYLKGEPLKMTNQNAENDQTLSDFKAARAKVIKIANAMEGSN